MMISNPVKKLKNISCKKVIKEKVTEIWSFLLYLLCVKVFDLYLFWGIFMYFFQGIRISMKVCVL